MAYKDPDKQRAYQAKYFRENRCGVKDARRNKTNLLRRHIQDVKSNTPCADCKNFYHYCVMDFDHLPQFEKLGNISKINTWSSLEKLEEEIAKCEVVCANCHRLRSYKRMLKLEE